jgi:hypothetical protein
MANWVRKYYLVFLLKNFRSFNKNERNWDEQNKKMNKVKDELSHSQKWVIFLIRKLFDLTTFRVCKELDRIIEDQRNEIEELEKFDLLFEKLF